MAPLRALRAVGDGSELWFGGTVLPGAGRPRTRPDRVLADKAYTSRSNRRYLRRRGIRHTLPERLDQVLDVGERTRVGHADPELDLRHAWSLPSTKAAAEYCITNALSAGTGFMAR